MRALLIPMVLVLWVGSCGPQSVSQSREAGYDPPSAEISAALYRIALQAVGDSASIPALHVDPRTLVPGPRDISEPYLFELSEQALVERRQIIADLGFDTADALLAANCPGPFMGLTVDGDTVIYPPEVPEELQRRCDARPGTYAVLIQEMPVQTESGRGWHVTVRITGASMAQTWAVTVPRDLSDAAVTLVDEWWF